MSGILDLYRQDEQRVLDRLADGELSDADVRELISALDGETDGWRRCALAFVESQALRGDMRGLQTEVGQRSTEPARPAMIWRKQLWSACLALAACLLVAFGLGLFVGRDNSLARRSASPPDKPQMLAGEGPARAAAVSADGWRTVKLNIDDSVQGKSRDIELPVRDMASLDPNWGADDQSAISAEVLRALEQSGHVVTREQELWPIELKDGRRLVVPVEQVEVQNIGYQ
jgi:hypothetical protein